MHDFMMKPNELCLGYIDICNLSVISNRITSSLLVLDDSEFVQIRSSLSCSLFTFKFARFFTPFF